MARNEGWRDCPAATTRSRGIYEEWIWHGSTKVPSEGGGPSIGVDASTIIDGLEFAFLGGREARKGRWGLFNDLVYVDLGSSKSASRDFTVGRAALPAGVELNAELDIEAWV